MMLVFIFNHYTTTLRSNRVCENCSICRKNVTTASLVIIIDWFIPLSIELPRNLRVVFLRLASQRIVDII